MVESRFRRYCYFFAFLIPCLVLYTVFFIYPFLNGFYISLTNWDGLTPRAPIVLDATTFENQILGNLKKQSDKDFLLSIYTRNDDGSSWNRLSLSGSERRKAESIMAKAGYEPDANRFVGLRNYRDILSGKISETFYPRAYSKNFYTRTSDLPQQIDKKDFDRDFLSKLNQDERAIFDRSYSDAGATFTLSDDASEFAYEDLVWLIPEIETDAAIDPDLVTTFIDTLRAATLDGSQGALDSAVGSFVAGSETGVALSPESADAVRKGAEGIYSLGTLKNLLSDKWVARGFDLGVIGFTVFFAVFSVIGINLLAFLLALALDSGIKGQKALRSVFFLPNVLSMIIVALIWKMLFFQLFPKLTGIDQWLSDPAKTPWLIVLVAVWQGAGYYMIVYLAGLQNIPTDVVEAAKIDGAGSWQRFKSITLPLLLPAVTISLFLTIANALKNFDMIYAMTSGSAYTFGTVPVVLDIFFDAFARKQAGLATAKAMLLFVLIFAITSIQLYVMKKREVEQ